MKLNVMSDFDVFFFRSFHESVSSCFNVSIIILSVCVLLTDHTPCPSLKTVPAEPGNKGQGPSVNGGQEMEMENKRRILNNQIFKCDLR